MTDRIVRPIRAWAEYDDWLVFAIQSAFETGGVRSDGWQRSDIPQTGKGVPQQYRINYNLADALSFTETGPLRSLRVLYDNGIELKLQKYANINGLDITKRHWHWYLRGADAAGEFAEDKDSEAVERAMIAAAAWFTQEQTSE